MIAQTNVEQKEVVTPKKSILHDSICIKYEKRPN